MKRSNTVTVLLTHEQLRMLEDLMKKRINEHRYISRGAIFRTALELLWEKEITSSR